jgi:hypothetical protein
LTSQFQPDEFLSKISKIEVGEGGRKLIVLNLTLNTTWMLKEIFTHVFTEKEKFGSTSTFKITQQNFNNRLKTPENKKKRRIFVIIKKKCKEIVIFETR